ncbi:hypothetical protein [Rhizobium sp. CSW-27]|uniref:hypothetical protein n=1 Tax=Rhizobium sp. CSW-27 TaxID=2839985 RepID=UPI001C00AE39|nr:hypothetical protein [Rhizobium sp. CSW-27]MBT9373434.1 hypothetical protein [Rhizobium sp. CSW-27]
MNRSATAERERKHRKYSGVSSQPHLGVQSLECAEEALRAVQSEFSWLSLAQIRKPPTSMMDAKFARQIAIHLMVDRLAMEQRTIARLQGRQRTSIHFALRTVNERMKSPMFVTTYERMALQIERSLSRHGAT